MSRQKSKGKYDTRPSRARWLPLVVMVTCFVLLSLGMVLATSPERYNLTVGDISPKTITATKDVVDEVTTESRRERAAEAVQPSYKEDEGAELHVLSNFDQLFEDFETVRAYGEGIRAGSIPSAAGEDAPGYNGSFQHADLDYARALSSRMTLSNWQLTILMRQSATDLNDLYVNTREMIRKQMESTIREGQLETAISAIQRQLLPTTSSDLCLNIAIPAVRATLVPNMIIDQEATEANREAARTEVEPTYYKSGQNIVVAGERVTQAQLAVLESLGLLEGNRFDMMMMIGVSLLCLLAMISLFFYLRQFDRRIIRDFKGAILLATIFLMTMLLCVLISRINTYLAPVSMVVLLVATLVSPSIAVVCNALALILVSVLITPSGSSFSQQMLYILISGTLSAPIGIYAVTRLRQQRASVLVAGAGMAVINFLAMISIGLLTNHEFRTILDKAIWAAGGNVLAAILCIGAQPILEWAFNLVTPFKLIELSNPNQALMRRLLVETPGTYHHSIMVANLAEAAAEAIGADPLLTRVGAYYHDIGKLKQPLFFKENQLGDNPHDRTDPRVSAKIICDHVTDGIHMARQSRLPEDVVDFIAQHHGNTTVGFFYHKMLNMPGGEDARMEDFQYPGPKPQSAETAILMLADTVEAAIRAGGDQPVDFIERRVRELVQDKISNGQLDESPLRFVDVQKIIRAFSQVLTGIYHKRIEYPQLANTAALPSPPAPRPPQPEIEIIPLDSQKDRKKAADAP